MTVTVQQQLLANGSGKELKDRGAGRSKSSENGRNIAAFDASSHDVVQLFDEQADLGNKFNEALGYEHAVGEVR